MKKNMINIFENFFMILGGIATVVMMVLLVKYFFGNEVEEEKKIAEALPGFETGVSAVEIRAELTAVGEFATAEYSYEGQAYVEKQRKFWGKKVPLTKHSISITYDGIIKIGYCIEEIDVEVKGDMIIITLPEPIVLDNYIDNYRTKEHNNILNLISSNEVAKKLEEVKELELEKAEEKGVYKLASKNVKFILADLLGKFDGYSVTFR